MKNEDNPSGNENDTFCCEIDFCEIDFEGPEMNACISYGDWEGMASGYQTAANQLVEYVKVRESERDSLVYPIAFLYRHSLELLLKVALQKTGESEMIAKQHRLQPFWSRIKPRVIERFKSDPAYLDIEKLEEVIGHFEAVDRGSFEFRYPFDTKGDFSLKGVSVVNLKTLANRANFAIEELKKILAAHQYPSG